MPKIEIELTDDTASIMGQNDIALQSMIELIAGPMSALIADTAKLFTDREWQAMATATSELELPRGERGRKRLLYLLDDAAEFDGLKSEFGIGMEALVGKIEGLSEMHLALTLVALKLARSHFPTRITSQAWWTLKARSELPGQAAKRASSDATDKRRRGPNKKNKEEVAAAKDDNTELRDDSLNGHKAYETGVGA